jgi:agmatine deiminase
VTHEVISRLEDQTECRIVRVPAPKVLKDSHGFVDYSYINHYILNDAVLLCSFDDPNDDTAKGILQEVYPEREIRLIDARPIFDRGGGIHCITQQQPAI